MPENTEKKVKENIKNTAVVQQKLIDYKIKLKKGCMLALFHMHKTESNRILYTYVADKKFFFPNGFFFYNIFC